MRGRMLSSVFAAALVIAGSLMVGSAAAAAPPGNGRGCDTDNFSTFGPGSCVTLTGDRIVLDGGDQVFTAGEPFWIAAGWVFPTSERDIPAFAGGFDMILEVDGEPVDDYYVNRVYNQARDAVNWRWIWTFPEGMTGTHTFEIRLFSACGYSKIIESLYGVVTHEGPCASPVEPVEWVDFAFTGTVDFD